MFSNVSSREGDETSKTEKEEYAAVVLDFILIEKPEKSNQWLFTLD